MGTQKRWVLLEIDVAVPEQETAKILDESIADYITNELQWCRDSFSDMKILEISDEYDNGIGVDGE